MANKHKQTTEENHNAKLEWAESLGVDPELLNQFENLSEKELRSMITHINSRAPKPNIRRYVQLLKQGYRDVQTMDKKTQELVTQEIKIPIHDTVDLICKVLRSGARAENIPIEVAKGWKDTPAFDWSNQRTRAWVFLRAIKLGVDPAEALKSLDPELPRRPIRAPESGTYSFGVRVQQEESDQRGPPFGQERLPLRKTSGRR